MRYEVGLLTRNIVVQGDDASESQMFGGHIMSLQGGIMRVENIEIRRNGQSHNLGRYSIHFHLAGAVPDSYIRSNSIHDSFQRAVTVHGSHYARVQNNVAAFVRGHTYFVEDGNEKYNVLEGNLGVHTTRLASMLKSDMKVGPRCTANRHCARTALAYSSADDPVAQCGAKPMGLRRRGWSSVEPLSSAVTHTVFFLFSFDLLCSLCHLHSLLPSGRGQHMQPCTRPGTR